VHGVRPRAGGGSRGASLAAVPAPAPEDPAAAADRPPAALDVPVRLTGPDAVLPGYALPGDAGADLCLAEDVELAPHQRALVGTGVAVAIPDGFAGFVHPRPGR
jgi:dUTP pyrophosphatase